MLELEKLSEKNLYEALGIIYPGAIITPQKRVKLEDRTCIVDYEVLINNEVIYIEFDGPTHYTSSKTQIRDQVLKWYCIDSNIKLVRVPYFIQLDDRTIRALFNVSCDSITSVYKNGFYDSKGVLPADYNFYGWGLFMRQYESFMKADAFSVSKEIWESIEDIGNPCLTIGIGWQVHETKRIFLTQYPT